jgi:hypothetical protein
MGRWYCRDVADPQAGPVDIHYGLRDVPQHRSQGRLLVAVRGRLPRARADDLGWLCVLDDRECEHCAPPDTSAAVPLLGDLLCKCSVDVPAQLQVIGTAIPQVQTIQALVGAAFLLQFSYTFPPLMQLSFDVQADASKQDGLYRPDSGPNRIDNWSQWSRWRRGLFTGRVAFKGVNLVYLLASLATCALGIWGSVSSTSCPGLILRWKQSRPRSKRALRQALAVRHLYECALE